MLGKCSLNFLHSINEFIEFHILVIDIPQKMNSEFNFIVHHRKIIIGFLSYLFQLIDLHHEEKQ